MCDALTVHGLFATQVQSQPEATAISAWDGYLTYRELDILSTNLAAHLANTPGFGGSHVPLMVESSKLAPIGMLAVLKTGKAFIAIDGNQPAAYCEQILQQLDATTLLTSQLKHGMQHGLEEVLLDEDLIETLHFGNPEYRFVFMPADVAFIMFTSGSTGTPSGVVIPHRAITAGIWAYQSHLALDGQTRMLQVTAFSWLPCTVEIFATLINGGQIFIPSKHEKASDLANYIQTHRVNTAVMTPSLLSTLEPTVVPSLKILAVGGERLTQSVVDIWAARLDLVMAYGSTETNLCLVQHVHPGEFRLAAVPIGCTAWIIHPSTKDRLLHSGEVGELIIEGPALARHYLNQPLKTQSKFFNRPPWTTESSDELSTSSYFATGDLALKDAHGRIVLRGRIDNAIKIRGQKVDPDLVAEHVRSLLPCHVAATVLPVGLADIEQQVSLVAFVGTGNQHDNSPLSLSGPTKSLLCTLQDRLAAVLPQHLHPTGFIAMTQLPLNLSGKVDRKKLIDLASKFTALQLASHMHYKSQHLAPCTTTEQILHKLWCKHLNAGESDVGLDDHFIRLGGDSLLAIRISSDLRKLGYELAGGDFMRWKTLREQAYRIRTVTAPVSAPEPFELLAQLGDPDVVLEELRREHGVDRQLVEDVLPLTPLQSAMIATSERHSGSYVAQMVVKLSPGIDMQRFKHAWSIVVEAVGILRSTVRQTSFGPVQVQAKRSLIWHEDSADLEQYLKEDELNCLDHGVETIRLAIISFANKRHFVCTAHHVVLDAWTARRLFEIVENVYAGSNMPILPPFRIFVKQLLRRDPLASQAFWEDYLNEAALTEFPPLTSEVKGYAGRASMRKVLYCYHDTTNGHNVASIVHTAWAIMLSIYTGSDDISFGTVLSGRNGLVEGGQDIIGPTITTVPMRVVLKPGCTVGSVVADVEETIARLADRGMYTLHEIAKMGPSCKRACGFRTLLNLQMTKGSSSTTLLGQPVQVVNWNSSSEHPITLDCVVKDDTLECDLTYHQPSMSEEQATLLLSHLQAVLESIGMSRNSDRTIQDIDMFSPQDSQAILRWNGESPAWVVVAMLGILKSGAAFVLLDQGQPRAWIDEVIQSVEARIMMVSCSTSDYAIPADRQRIQVDAAASQTWPARKSTSALQSPDQPAFVVYTSGTSGQPKLMCHSHKGYVSGLLARKYMLHRDQHSRVLQFSSFAFDVPIEDVLATLLVGGVVCIPSEEERVNDLYGFIDRHSITHADLTPSFASALDPDRMPSLRVLTLGGEKLQRTHRDRWAHKVLLINAYGPSEVAVTSHLKMISPEDDPGSVGHGYGCQTWVTRPDNSDKLQAVGAIGELLLEGPILCEGYLNDSPRTRTAFISNPQWAGQGNSHKRRFYRTGDLARYNADGTISIIGRKDGQRKLRGQRLELTAVESCVRELLPILQGSVAGIVRLPGSSVESLVIFAAVSRSAGFLETDVRQQIPQSWELLRSKLPAHMVPVALVVIDKIPLGLTGKADRKALQDLVDGTPSDMVVFLDEEAAEKDSAEPYEDQTEVRIGDMFAKVLRIPQDSLGRNSHFFRRGGDSILAMQLVALGSLPDYNIGLTVQRVFQTPTVRDLASSVKKSQDPVLSVVAPFSLYSDSQVDLNTIAAKCEAGINDIEDLYPCSPLQADLMARSMVAPGRYVLHQRLKLQPTIDPHQLQNAWTILLAETPILRTRIVQTEASTIQVVVRNRAQDQIGQSGDTDGSRAEMSEGQPLVRWSIVQSTATVEFRLSIHHALYDGWSLSLLLKRFADIYLATKLLPAVMPYNLFIQYISATDKDSAHQYWAAYLEGVRQRSIIFPRVSRESTVTKADRSFDMMIDLPNARLDHITQATVLQAAWTLVVSRHTSCQDVVFGSTRTGRDVDLPHIQAVMGPTFATVPVRAILQDNVTVAAFLSQFQAQAMESVPFQHLGLQQIKSLSEDAAAACSFSTLLVIQAQEQDGLQEEVFADHHIEGDISQFNPTALMIQFVPMSKHAVRVNVSYDSSVMSEPQLRQMISQTEKAVFEISGASRHNLVSDLDILTKADLEWIIKSNNGCAVPKAEDSCVHKLVQRHVLVHPHATAVESREDRFSYERLNDLSTNLAHRLRLSSVTTGSVVLLHFEKSVLATICMFAVWKAGAAFVLLDSNHPGKRLNQIGEESQATLVLTTSPDTAPVLKSFRPAMHITQEYLNSLPPGDSAAEVADPQNLACIIFTSGSTGIPKGIELQHRALSTSILAHGPALGIGRQSRVYQFASFAFDMALFDICTTLVMGGCVCIPSEFDRLNRLAETLVEMDCNWAFFTPTILSTIQPSEVPTLSKVTVGGEFVTQQILDTWTNAVELYQCSGPAETTTCITGRMMPSTPRNTIGRPRAALCWVVDQSDHDRLAPPGSVGEMILEGPTLSLGYLNDLGSNAFVCGNDMRWAVSLFGPEARYRRMFRTGDLVQQDFDGTLRIIGRRDDQVKLRGQRIELDEIDNQIRQCMPDLLAVAGVVTLRESSGAPELVVFASDRYLDHSDGEAASTGLVVVTCDRSIEVRDHLESHLTQRLPAYMIPSRYIWINGIPLNVSNKIDRRKLQEFGSQLSATELDRIEVSHEEHDHKLSDTEICLRGMWAKVLTVEETKIRRTSNFIGFGGDSVTAMRLAAVARKGGKRLSVQHIMTKRQLGSMAAKMSALEGKSELQPAETPSDAWNHFVAEHISSLCGVSSGQVQDCYPCTPIQEGLMCISVQNPGSYTAQDIFELDAMVDIDRFKAACGQVAERAVILRTSIVELPDQSICQAVIRDDLQWSMATDLEEYLSVDRSSPIEYGNPLVRWAIVTEATTRYFVWTRHHASYDGDSFNLTLKAIEDTYKAAVSDRPSPPTSFKFFVKHVRSKKDDHAAFWQTVLSDCTTLHYPPATKPALSSDATSLMKVDFPLEARSQSTFTLPIIIRAAFALAVAVRLGSHDVVFGEMLSGRDVPVDGIEELLAPTFCTVPIHLTILRNGSTFDYLEKVESWYAEMAPHQHHGLQEIMRISPDIRTASQFRTLLSIQAQSHAVQGTSILKPYRSESHATFYTHPLTIIFQIAPRALSVEAHYFGNQVSADEVHGLTQQFGHILQQFISSDITQSLSDISLVPSAEVKRMQDLNALYRITEVDVCVHDLFEKQVRTRPGDLAVVTAETSWTYIELNGKCNHLARQLQGRGILPGQIVPVYIGKSPWFIVALIAIMKAGGAYVGLDPAHYASRTETIIRELEAPIILSTTEYSQRLGPLQINVITLDDRNAGIGADELGWPTPSVAPEDPAMIVFTSGSTGTPKGIMLEHKALATAISVQAGLLNIGRGTRTLHFASPAWDVLLAEILMPLTTGGTVCIPTDEERDNDLPDACRTLKPDWMLLTPRTLSLFTPQDFPTIRTMATGGEKADEKTMNQWKSLGRNFVNIYGPAECCLFVMLNHGHGDVGVSGRLGKGITGQLWVVDPDDHDILLPPGCIGELFIEGPVLARGYLKDPGRTRSSFITSPKWASSEATEVNRRMFKTGDLVRQNHDGSFDFVGRKDSQVKINSQRLEPGEVEQAIKAVLPAEWQVAVDKVEARDEGLQACLVAFVALGESVSSKSSTDLVLAMTLSLAVAFDEVRSSISATLPRFMQPDLYIPVVRLPLNANQKLDRAGLRALVWGMNQEALQQFRQQSRRGRRPQGQQEETLALAWSHILGIDASKIKASDNFFGLGGDSILAMKMVGHLRSLGISMTVKQIFEQPILSQLATTSEMVESTIGSPSLAPFSMLDVEDRDTFLRRVVCPQLGCSVSNINDVYPATGYQEQVLASSLQKDRGLLGYFFFTSRAAIDMDCLQHAVKQTVTSFAILRTRFVQYKGHWLQVVLSKDDIEFEFYSSTEVTEVVAESIGSQDLQRSLRAKDRFLRVFIVENSKSGEHTMIIRLSHAQYDGLCVPAVWKSIEHHFSGSIPAPNTTSFGSFIHQLQFSKPADWQDHWRSVLAGSSPSSLVTRQLHGLNSDQATLSVVRKLPVEVCLDQGLTTATYMRTAWALTLIDLLGSPDVTFAVLVAGRNLPLDGIENVVGACINIIPVRVKLSSQTTTEDLLRLVQQRLTDGIRYEHTDIRDIIKHCTDWPSWIRIGSIFQHDDHISAAPSFKLGDAEYKTSGFCNPAAVTDVAVHTSVEDGDVTVRATSLCREINKDHLEMMVEKFGDKLKILQQSLGANQAGIEGPSAMFPLDGFEDTLKRPATGASTGVSSLLSDGPLERQMQSILQEAWTEVLVGIGTNDFELEDSFFDKGGDLVSAAYLTTSLQHQGFDVVMEDIISRPRLVEQMALLVELRSMPSIELED
ncbi:AMP-binding enzyme-like protein 9 [Elsinoe fawcettii]|nr:AMP-binding enzyme-like protein 9 [Elsinoe fawcettii]